MANFFKAAIDVTKASLNSFRAEHTNPIHFTHLPGSVHVHDGKEYDVYRCGISKKYLEFVAKENQFKEEYKEQLGDNDKPVTSLRIYGKEIPLADENGEPTKGGYVFVEREDGKEPFNFNSHKTPGEQVLKGKSLVDVYKNIVERDKLAYKDSYLYRRVWVDKSSELYGSRDDFAITSIDDEESFLIRDVVIENNSSVIHPKELSDSLISNSRLSGGSINFADITDSTVLNSSIKSTDLNNVSVSDSDVSYVNATNTEINDATLHRSIVSNSKIQLSKIMGNLKLFGLSKSKIDHSTLKGVQINDNATIVEDSKLVFSDESIVSRFNDLKFTINESHLSNSNIDVTSEMEISKSRLDSFDHNTAGVNSSCVIKDGNLYTSTPIVEKTREAAKEASVEMDF